VIAMISTSNADVYTDIHGLDSIRRESRTDSKKALRDVAQQFESIFLKMMLKSMRDASFGDPLFDSDNSKFYRQMYDDQLTMDLSKKGSVGLADVLVQQLGKYLPDEAPADKKEASNPLAASNTANQLFVSAMQAAKVAAPAVEPAVTAKSDLKSGSPESFVNELWPLAEQHARDLGVKPQVLLAQAALETGWGKHVINRTDGNSSFNLFNIKADQRWQGDKAQVATLEYRNGVAKKEQASFRAYDSFAQSFSDYVSFVKNSPRYEQAVKHAANAERYVDELHQAGYATDPQYADKIKSIMQREPIATHLAAANAVMGQ
jgi:flagellar protein FlgJ